MFPGHFNFIMAMLCGGMFVIPAVADMQINMRGTLVVLPCVVNDNSPVEVDFGEISREVLTTANTPYYSQDFTVSMNCAYFQGVPMMTVTASGIHNATEGTIQTSRYDEGLIIFLRKQGGATPVPIGSAIDITDSLSGSDSTRTLTLNAGVGRFLEMDDITPGTFSGTIALQVIYQ